MKSSLIIIFSSILFISTAQENLTALDAVRIGLENNYQIQIAELQKDAAVTNNTWGEAGAYPTVTLSTGNNNTIQDNAGNPFSFPGATLSQGLQPSLAVNWNIFSGFAVRISKTRLELMEEQSTNNAMSIIESTIQDILKAYFTVQLQKERRVLFENILNLSREQYRYYQIKEKYSTANSLELLQFRNQYLTDSTNFLMQDISHRNALRNLLLLMNLDSIQRNTVYNLTDNIELNPELIDYDKLKSQLIENNHNLRNQMINIELQQTNTAFQKSFLYPTLSFQAGINKGWTWIDKLDTGDPTFKIENLSYYGNLNLRYTIYNNWKTKRAIEVSRIQENIQDLTRESMEKTLLSTMQNLIELYDVRNSLVNISTENIEYAKQAFDLAEKRFDQGSINSIALEGFKNNYQNTLIQHYENLFNRLDTYLELLRMSGNLSLQYVKE